MLFICMLFPVVLVGWELTIPIDIADSQFDASIRVSYNLPEKLEYASVIGSSSARCPLYQSWHS